MVIEFNPVIIFDADLSSVLLIKPDRLATTEQRQKLLAVRYLDDWAYQANIRWPMVDELLVPRNVSVFYLNELRPLVTEEGQKRIRQFAAEKLWLKPEQVDVTFPWNRMFEVSVNIKE